MLASLLTLSGCSDEEDATRIVIGKSNVLLVLSDTQYQDPFVVQVTTLDGNAAPNTTVTLTLRSTNYYRGFYATTGSGWAPTLTATCPNEDANLNGVLDAGEDINNNGRLDPTQSATITAHPTQLPTLIPATNTLVTDEFGFGYFSLVYPKSEANWSGVEVTASAEVSGTEESALFNEDFLPVLLSDVEDETINPPGGVNSRYGTTNNCGP